MLEHIRPELEEQYEIILEWPPSTSRQKISVDEGPLGFVTADGGADRRIFVLLRRFELTEIFPQLKGKEAKDPVILKPIFCRGGALLAKELEDMPNHYRKGVVMEIAYAATFVREVLDRIPAVTRGRK